MYDLALGVSTFRSVYSAERFLKSLPYLDCTVYCGITGTLEDEIAYLSESYQKTSNVTVSFFHSRINNLQFGRAWAYLHLLHNNQTANYYVEADDDLEFTLDSGMMYQKLAIAPAFSLCSFDSTHPMHYPEFEYQLGEWKIGVPWVDGNCIFSRWVDNLQFGLQDSLPDEPFSFFVEAEYGHRMRYFTDQPIIVNSAKRYYIHHFREAPIQRKIRQTYHIKGILAGERFFLEKFGIREHFDHASVHNDIYAAIKKDAAIHGTWKLQRHMMFNGGWNDYNSIYDSFCDKVTLMAET